MRAALRLPVRVASPGHMYRRALQRSTTMTHLQVGHLDAELVDEVIVGHHLEGAGQGGQETQFEGGGRWACDTTRPGGTKDRV